MAEETKTEVKPATKSDREKQLERALKDVLFAFDEQDRTLRRMGVAYKADDSVEAARGLVK